MYRIILLIALFAQSYNLTAQDSDSRPVKFIQFSLHTLGGGIEMYPFENQSPYIFAGPSIGIFKLKSHKSYSYFELSGMAFRDDFLDYELKKKLVGLRLEKGSYISTSFEDKFRLSIGASVEFSFSNQNREPKSSPVFPRNDRTISFTAAATPHLQYSPAEKIYFDFAPSLALWSFGYERSITENPALTERQQHRGGFLFETFGFVLRLGFGIRF